MIITVFHLNFYICVLWAFGIFHSITAFLTLCLLVEVTHTHLISRLSGRVSAGSQN